MTDLYITQVTARGGRQGTVRSDDGLLDLRLALPGPLGGKGGSTNPEQLFAGGYAACFGNALIHVARTKNRKVSDEDVEVIAQVGVGPNGSGGFKLSVSLAITIVGVDQSTAEEIVAAAHAVCPYSNAVRGNIDVSMSTATR